MSTEVQEAAGAPDGAAPAPASTDHPTGTERLFGAIVAGVFLTLLTMVFVAARPLRDPDTWWHIVMGHAYLAGESVRNPGAMSPLGNADWHSRDWLAQITIALFDKAFGLPGVAWLFGLGLVALFVSVFRLCRREAPFGPAVVATGVGFFSMMGSLAPRPQVVTFILLVITLGALLGTVRDLRPRWWLAPLIGVWACTHGMWSIGLGLQLVVLVGLLMDRRLDRAAALRLLLLFGLSVVAVAITPNGLFQLTHPLGQSVDTFEYVQEYQPASMSYPPFVTTLAMFSVVCVVWARAGKVAWVDLAVVGTGMFFALYMGRTLTLGAILLTPYFARSAATWWPPSKAILPRAVERAVVYGGGLVSLLVLAAMVPSTSDVPGSEYPNAYDARLKAIPDEAVVMNELGDGGYLAWKYPDMRIVGDGLSDQYSVSWLEDWYLALRGEPDWQLFVQRSGADYALLYDRTPLRLGLLAEGWVPVQEGQDRVLLKAPER